MPSLLEDRAKAAYAAKAARVRAQLLADVDDAFDDLEDDDGESFDDEDVDDFVATVVPRSVAAQQAVVGTLAGYLLVVTGDDYPDDYDAADFVGQPREDGTTLDHSWRVPFFSMWKALGEGADFGDAMAKARVDCQTAAATDLAVAQTTAMAALSEKLPRVTGYRRVTEGEGCPFCDELAGAIVPTGEPMPLHPGCLCTVEPVLEGED